MNSIKITKSLTQRDEFINLFFSQISKYNVLTPEEESIVARNLFDNGNMRDEARNELIVHNLRFTISVAKKYCNLGISFIDLINEACIGLCKAADTFDPSRGCKFISHAVSYMRAQILDAFEKYGKTISTPHDIFNLQHKYRRFCEIIFANEGRIPTAVEFADFAGISVKKAKRVIKSISKTESLDAPVAGCEDGEFSLSETIVGGVQDVSHLDNEALRKELKEILFKVLGERDAKLIMAKFGLSNESLHELTYKYGTTYDAIRKVIARALDRIKQNKEVLSRLQEYRYAA